MHPEPIYRWEDSRRPSTFRTENMRNLGWWVLLAVLISVLLHVALYLFLGAMEWHRQMNPGFREQIRFRNENKQLVIDRDALENFLPQPEIKPEPIEPTKISDMPLVNEILDEFDLMEEVIDQEVKLTPEINTEELLGVERPKAAQQIQNPGAMAGPVEVTASDLFSDDMKEMRQKLIEAPIVSKDQPILSLNPDEKDNLPDTDDFFRQAASKATQGNPDQIMKGYSDLDDLIGKTGGGLPDSTKPVLMPTDLLFDYDSDELKETAKLSMMKLAFLIQTNPGSRFIIEGHTDSFGDDEYNRQLSLRRASAVRDWLKSTLKLTGNNVIAAGMGETRPLVSPDGSVEDQALNRRVEIVIKK